MAKKKPTTRTLLRWIRTLGACNGSAIAYGGLGFERAWSRAKERDEQQWIITRALGIEHGDGGSVQCWCSKPKAKFKGRVLAKFKNWQRASRNA